MPFLRTALALAALSLAAATPAGAADPSATTEPRHQLLGDWRLEEGASSYRFSSRRGRVEGRTRRTLRLRGCTIRRGAVVFRGYRFSRRRGASDIWRGRVAFMRDGCRRVFVRSTIVVRDDLRFTETAVLNGRPRAPGTFERIRPRVRDTDPVVATWIRSSAGVVVTAVGRVYEGRARESFLIGNGCTIAAGTLVWRLQPVAPGRYDGTVQTFRDPRADCRPGKPAESRWRLDAPGRLIRISAAGDSFGYRRG